MIKGLPKKSQKIINYCHEVEATDSKVYQKALSEYYDKHVFRKPKNYKKKKRPQNPHGDKIYAHMWGPSEFKATGTLKRYEHASKLKSVHMPVLLVCGKYDEATPQTSAKYQKQFPNCTFKVIDKASHVISRENPEDLIRTLKLFLS